MRTATYLAARIIGTNLLLLVPTVVATLLFVDEKTFDWARSTIPWVCSPPHPSAADACKRWLRLEVIGLGVVLGTLVQLLELYVPLLRLEDIRRVFAKEQLQPIYQDFVTASSRLARRSKSATRKQKGQAGRGTKRSATKFKAHKGLRLNIMVLKRAWWSLFLLRRFRVVHGVDFRPNDPDSNLCLFSNQGLSGDTVASGEGQSKLVRQEPKPQAPLWSRVLNEFREDPVSKMYPWQLRRTRHVYWVWSIPMSRINKNGTLEVVGVINIDAVDDSVAEMLGNTEFENWPEALQIYERFMAAGKLAATLW